jgi:hypothetical protein
MKSMKRTELARTGLALEPGIHREEESVVGWAKLDFKE